MNFDITLVHERSTSYALISDPATARSVRIAMNDAGDLPFIDRNAEALFRRADVEQNGGAK